MQIIECPRDAMQGFPNFIPTQVKVDYLSLLLKIGFDTLDFGSFVSSKAMPQMADTKEVIPQLDLSYTNTKLLAIVANVRGAVEAANYDEIQYLGFPFSISETFQLRNTNSTIEQSLSTVEEIQNICHVNDKDLVLYISMAFGNPYDDPWNIEEVSKWVERMVELEIKIISLADTVGVSNPENIAYLFSQLIPQFPNIEFGAHLHTTPDSWEEKVEAAYSNGCKRFDGAIKGLGGCPMAKDELVGNMPTENMVNYFANQGIQLGLDQVALNAALNKSNSVFV
ncbi:hydroxymethylglutaryl-CoA lyase [Cytophagaceae bacterium AH-315-L13]|nr:hydroxymethylglutaryl-CoA lyase [Cytophagaceae bacterium AH-315-L13]